MEYSKSRVSDEICEAVIMHGNPQMAADLLRSCVRNKMQMSQEQEHRLGTFIAEDIRAADRVVGGPCSVTHRLSPWLSQHLRAVAQPEEDRRLMVYGLGYMMSGLTVCVYLYLFHFT